MTFYMNNAKYNKLIVFDGQILDTLHPILSSKIAELPTKNLY